MNESTAIVNVCCLADSEIKTLLFPLGNSGSRIHLGNHIVQIFSKTSKFSAQTDKMQKICESVKNCISCSCIKDENMQRVEMKHFLVVKPQHMEQLLRLLLWVTAAAAACSADVTRTEQLKHQMRTRHANELYLFWAPSAVCRQSGRQPASSTGRTLRLLLTRSSKSWGGVYLRFIGIKAAGIEKHSLV